MRYYQRDCPLPGEVNLRPMERCRRGARALLYGRLSRNAVIWMGMFILALLLVISFWSMARFDTSPFPVHSETPMIIDH